MMQLREAHGGSTPGGRNGYGSVPMRCESSLSSPLNARTYAHTREGDGGVSALSALGAGKKGGCGGRFDRLRTGISELKP
jgi:hypothetical protein